MTDTTLARCNRTGGIVKAILDGNEGAPDRAHLAACATCSREAERAVQFRRSLSVTALEASEGVPDAGLLVGREGSGLRRGRTGRLTLRILTLAGAVAAGLVIATLIGSRALAPTGRGPSIFGPSVAAQQRLSAMDLACGQKDGLVECMSIAKDHMHRVLLTLDGDGEIVGVEARIDSTDGGPLKLDGAEGMLARFASAVLTPEVRGQVARWVGHQFDDCETTCLVNVAGVDVKLTKEPGSVVLTLTPR